VPFPARLYARLYDAAMPCVADVAGGDQVAISMPVAPWASDRPTGAPGSGNVGWCGRPGELAVLFACSGQIVRGGAALG